MRYLVAVIAVLLMVISALGVVAPERLVAIVTGWPPRTLTTMAVVRIQTPQEPRSASA